MIARYAYPSIAVAFCAKRRDGLSFLDLSSLIRKKKFLQELQAEFLCLPGQDFVT